VTAPLLSREARTEPGAEPRAPFQLFALHNLITYLGAAAALGGALLAAGAGSRPAAGICLAAAVLADVFDGRFARLFRRSETEQRFGVELDSLVDAVSFGFAPLVVLWRLSSPPPAPTVAGALWLLCGLFYLLAAVTRLGFYNVATGGGHHGFVGVPTTMIGFFWTIWLLFDAPPAATAVALAVTGAAMVSPFKIDRPGARAIAVLAVATAVVLAAHIRHATGS